MPNITMYLDDDVYVKFLQLEDGKKKEIKKEMIKIIKKEVS